MHRIVSAFWLIFCLFIMLTFLSSVCSVSPEAGSSFRAGLRKHWKGVVSFISHLLVNFKLSNSRQQKYCVIIRKTVLRNTDWVNLWMNLSVTKLCCCYVSAYFFKSVYANPWPSLVGIRRIPAYHVDYTTARKLIKKTKKIHNDIQKKKPFKVFFALSRFF